jgi:hypothetical protein
MRLAVAASTVLIAGLLRGIAAGDSGPTYFPSPPPGVTLNTATGILTDYYVGMKSGQLTIKTSSGSGITYYVGNAMVINGAPVHCIAPPINGSTPPPGLCPDWPSNIVIGTTKVTVFYWYSQQPGSTKDYDSEPDDGSNPVT